MKSNAIDIGIKNTSVLEKSFTEWILKHLLVEPSHSTNIIQQRKKPQKITQIRFQKKVKVSVKVFKFNVKRYYLSDGILSFPFDHPYLDKVRKYKKDMKIKTTKTYWRKSTWYP